MPRHLPLPQWVPYQPSTHGLTVPSLRGLRPKVDGEGVFVFKALNEKDAGSCQEMET